MSVDPAEAESAVRISLGWDTTAEDIERLIIAWQGLYTRVGYSDMSRQAMSRQAA
jgi:cysteine desulfurase